MNPGRPWPPGCLLPGAIATTMSPCLYTDERRLPAGGIWRAVNVEIDEFVEQKVLPQYRDIVQVLRALMKECAPRSTEGISYGIPAFRGKRILALISPTKKGITFAFARGAEFEDKYGLLEGSGNVSRNVRMRRVEDINRDALRDYIRQALEIDAGDGK